MRGRQVVGAVAHNGPLAVGQFVVGIWAKVARILTHKTAASALFVILSEAKDLPSGIRLWKMLRQAQHDKTTTPEKKKTSIGAASTLSAGFFVSG